MFLRFLCFVPLLCLMREVAVCITEDGAPGWRFYLSRRNAEAWAEYSQFLLWCDSSMGEECVGGQGVGEWILSSTWFMEVSCRLGWGGSVIHTVRHTAVQGGQKNGRLCPAHYLLCSLQCWQTSSVPCSSLCVWIHGLVTTYLASSQAKQGS